MEGRDKSVTLREVSSCCSDPLWLLKFRSALHEHPVRSRGRLGNGRLPKHAWLEALDAETLAG